VTIHLTDFLIIVVTVFLPVVATAMARYFQNAGNPHKARALQQWALLAVSAAEEYARNHNVPSGQKLRYATEFLKSVTGKAGVRLNDDQLKLVIEAVLNDTRPYLTVEGVPDVTGTDAV